MTLALLARDPETGNFGVAVATSTIAAGGLDGIGFVPGLGICLAIAVPGYCHRVGAAILKSGCDAQTALAAMVGGDGGASYRQFGVIDSAGGVAGHTGKEVPGYTPEDIKTYAAHKIGKDYVVLGNWLKGPESMESLERGFLQSKDETFARRLIAALEAGRDADGEIADPLASALVIAFASGEGAPSADYRVDLSDDPIAQLLRIHEAALPNQRHFELGRLDPGAIWYHGPAG